MTDGNKEDKQYGLIVPSKNRLSAPKPGNIFGEESGSDGDEGTDWVRKALRAEGEKNLVKKQTQLTMKRALKEDPTVYQYDEVYDDIERSKVEEKINKKTVEKKAKYIENLLKAADRRKREQEHRVERMVQKEREAEGAMFADKESFVTSAYRAKLEEFKKMEEEEKRMDRLEAIGDVTKQQDISGFYRHLYHQTVDGDKKDSEKIEVKKEHDEADKSSTVSRKEDANIDGDDPLTTDSDENSDDEKEQNSKREKDARQSPAKGACKRQYRKRMAEESQSSSESESEDEKSLSKGERVEEEKEEVPEKRTKLSPDDRTDKHKTDRTKSKRRESEENGKLERNSSGSEKPSKRVEEEEKTENSVKKVKKIEPETPKVSIWEKRTVGPVFEAALERYYARKAARSSG